LERDGELWNCLQTSAPGASSAPGLNYTSSQCLQNGSPLSPTVLDSPSITFTPAWKSQNYRQGSPFQQRMLEESSHTHDALNNNSSKGLPHSHQQTSEMRPYNCFERAHDVEEKIHKDETWDTWSFPLPIQEDEQTAESLTSSTTAPIPVPGRHRSGNPPSSNAEHGIGNDFPSYSELTGYSINRESWPKRQIEDQDILTAGKSSESQQPIPTELLGHLYGSTNSRHEEFGQSSWDFDQDPFSSPPYTAIGEAALHHCNNDSVSQEIPTTIRIPRSSQRYQPDQASSFPPTAGHYPKFMHAEQRTKKHRSTISTPRPVPPISSGISVPMRRESSRNKSTRGSRSGSLKAIPEDDHVSLCRSPAGSTRGRRNGRLKLATALAASEKRTTGTVCIRCKVLKQTVSAVNISLCGELILA